MLINLLGELAGRLLTHSVPKAGLVKLSYSDDAEQVDVVDNLKILERPSRIFRAGAVDASSTTIKVGGEVALSVGVVCGSSLVTYPDWVGRNVEAPFASALINEGLPGVTNSYIMLGVKYVDDPDLPEGALAHDVRISIETLMIKKAVNYLPTNSILLVDGPIHYPIHHPKAVSNWNSELARLNDHRVNTLREVVKHGLIPVNVVKRVWSSRYLPEAVGNGVTDLMMLERVLRSLSPVLKPVRTPVYRYVRGRGPERYFTYVVIPKSRVYGGYSIFRVEFLREVYEMVTPEFADEVVAYVAYEAFDYGLDIPYRLNMADTYSKKVIRSITLTLVNLMKLRGMSIPYGAVEDVGMV